MSDFGLIEAEKGLEKTSLPTYEQKPFMLLRPDEIVPEEARTSSRIKKKVSYNMDESQPDDEVTLLLTEERESAKAFGLKVKKAPKRRRRKESELYRRSLVPQVDIVLEYKKWTLKDHVQVFGSMHVIEYQDNEARGKKKMKMKVNNHSSLDSDSTDVPLVLDQDKEKN